jgi:uncharacterized membrane protein YoaK (UPF0700 family)
MVSSRTPRKRDLAEPLFRAARSVSGTRRRVTTAEVEEFRKELGREQSWSPGASAFEEFTDLVPAHERVPEEATQVERAASPSIPPLLPRSVPPSVAPAGRASMPSIPVLPSPWIGSAPSVPPPPSLWVPTVESTPPDGAPAVVAPPRASVAIATDSLRVGMLSTIAGFVDAAGFLTLFGLLPAHMTGDLVWAGAAVAQNADVGWVVRFAMLVLFIASVAITAVAARVVRRRGQSPLASLLSLMTIALGVFCAAGTVLGPLVTAPNGVATLFISGTGVMAMGIQNTIMREALGTLCPTTVMTGNLTQVTMDVVEIVFTAFDSPMRRPARRRKDAVARIKRFGLPIATFSAGCLTGAFVTTAMGFSSLAFPTIASLALTVHAFYVARRRP